jgi:hypothetical protein
MSKKLTLEFTPAQARTLVWAMNNLKSAYEGEDAYDEAARAFRYMVNNYIAAADFAEENGK